MYFIFIYIYRISICGYNRIDGDVDDAGMPWWNDNKKFANNTKKKYAEFNIFIYSFFQHIKEDT